MQGLGWILVGAGAAVVVALAVWFLLARRKSAAAPAPAAAPPARPAAPPAARPSQPALAAAPASAAAVDRDKVGCLVGLGGGAEGTSVIVASRPITIGSGPEADVRIPGAVAAVQTRLVPDGPVLLVTDVGAPLATRVNGRQVREGTLRWEDELTVGPARFVFRLQSAFAASAAAANQEEPTAVRAARSVERGTLRGTAMDENLSAATVYEAALQKAHGDVEAAARMVGLDPAAFRNELTRRGLDPAHYVD